MIAIAGLLLVFITSGCLVGLVFLASWLAEQFQPFWGYLGISLLGIAIAIAVYLARYFWRQYQTTKDEFNGSYNALFSLIAVIPAIVGTVSSIVLIILLQR